ncbi:MAG: alpha/beta hydrolase [Pyrinomonadaceae bacterium]
MIESDLSVKAEIDLYYDLYVPEGVGDMAPLLIAVHGYGAHKRYMMREAKLVAGDKFVIASLEAPHPHYRPTKDGGYAIGYGWLSSERSEENVRLHHKFVLDVIDRLDADGSVDRTQVFMYGFSQACALNFRFAFTYPEVLRGLIGVCGGIPGDLDTNSIYKPFTAETFYLYGDDDEFYTQEQFAEFDEKLSARLTTYRSKHYAAKHEITDKMRADIKQFLAKMM